MILRKRNGLLLQKNENMKQFPSKFEKEYFQGDKSNYTTCYDYKMGNISYLYTKKALPILKRSLDTKAKILDLGCAFGNLLSMLDKKGYKTYGLDISQYAIAKARKITKADLALGDVNKELPYNNNFFDAVFALDIIEHLNSPIEFVHEVARVVKKNGNFFIHTPNINSIFEKIFKEKWFGYRDDSHLYLFNKKNLKFLVEKAGFEVFINETISYPLPSILRQLLKNTDLGGSLWMVARKI